MSRPNESNKLSNQPKWVQKVAGASQGFFNSIKGLWNDYTGQTAVDKQNEANMALAKYQTQVQEEMYNKYSSPDALMRQYKQAGLNPNLVYGSASAGQSNVPSFNAPHVERNISGADKLNKALSVISAASGLVQNVYQASAAREAAEQSGIRTLRDMVGLAKEEGDLRLQNTLYGDYVYFDAYPRKFGNLAPMIGEHAGNNYITNYAKQWRDAQINNFIKSGLTNAADYGVYAGRGTGQIYQSDVFGTPYYRVRNAQNALRYRLNKELGNKGVYGKLAVSLFNSIL